MEIYGVLLRLFLSKFWIRVKGVVRMKLKSKTNGNKKKNTSKFEVVFMVAPSPQALKSASTVEIMYVGIAAKIAVMRNM